MFLSSQKSPTNMLHIPKSRMAIHIFFYHGYVDEYAYEKKKKMFENNNSVDNNAWRGTFPSLWCVDCTYKLVLSLFLFLTVCVCLSHFLCSEYAYDFHLFSFDVLYVQLWWPRPFVRRNQIKDPFTPDTAMLKADK